MNNSRGFVPLFIIIALLVVGGAGVAITQRETLKTYFEKGDKPAEQQFSDTIDSALNLHDDGVTEVGKTYNPTKEYVAGDTTVHTSALAPAKILSPGQSEFSLDAKQTVTFRWTPAKEQSTYRLKVWQLMQGQTGATAMRSNKPIVTRDVENMSEISVDSIYTGPCRPPYLCDFVWSVETLSKADATGGTAPATGAVLEPSATLEAGASVVTETKTR